MPKDKKYIVNNKLVMDRWDKSLNDKLGLNPNELIEGTHTKANFICPICGYKWSGEIRYVIKYKGGCKICSQKKRMQSWLTTKMTNAQSLFETNPELEYEWDYEKNNEIGLDPNYLVAGSNKKAFWICPLNHSYEAYIINRAKKHTGCTYCSGQAVLEGFNDLATTRKDLLDEWDYEKNNAINLFPNKVMRGNHESANWICPLGHSYVKSIHERDAGHGCIICAKESQTSFPEQAIYFYISKIFSDAKNRYGKPEIDIFIPSLNFGIEYDGSYSHKKKQKSEKKKNEILESRGIKLIRIKETTKLKKDSNNIIYCKANSNNTFLNDVVKKIERIINQTYNLDIKLQPNIQSDRIKIEEQYIFLRKQNSIGILYPELAKEWDDEKNGRIKPEFVSCGSSKKYFWLCSKGHSYECSPKDRINGRGCQVCGGYHFIKGTNDLETKYPYLLKFWDYNTNELKPNEVKYTNKNLFYWICEKGHSYPATIHQMNKNKCCLICKTNLKNVELEDRKKLNYSIRYNLKQGENDLTTVYPKLAEEWDYEKNELGPECYTSNSNKEVWWICSICGYNWKKRINKRPKCPNCKKNVLMINVYEIETGKFIGQFDNTLDLCDKMSINYNKQRGNITAICQRKQRSLKNKYILRHNNDDEFKNISANERKKEFEIICKKK